MLLLLPSLSRWPGRRSRRRNTTLRSSVGSRTRPAGAAVYLAKVRIVETVRAKAPAQLCGGCKDNNLCKGAGRAGARPLGHNGPPTGAAAENRKRRKKSEAQRQKGAQKLQHRWLQRRCEAAAAKPGGSPPKILARVLACCGRFFELLLPEGAERMQRLRDEQQAQSPAMEVDAGEAGLNAMRRALAEVEKKEVPPRAAPTDIGAPKGVAVKSTAEAIVAALDAERRALEPEVAQAAAECEAAAERTSTTACKGEGTIG